MNAYNAENFVKIVQTIHPWGTNFMEKFLILTTSQATNLHIMADKSENRHAADRLSA